MSASGDWPLGLVRLAAVLGRDLQAAARTAGGPARLWRLGSQGLARALDVEGAAAKEAIRARREIDPGGLRRGLRDQGIHFVGRNEQAFPARLAQLYDPPFGIFLRGAHDRALTALARGPVVAVVGSRRATPVGRAIAQSLGRELAERGALVVSGLAVGVDAAAHSGALAGRGGTVAFAGCGVDVPYPSRNRTLAERIVLDGAVVSEYWPGTRPAPWRFPARNRLVAGAADAVVVVEAGRRSGSLITAEFALEAGSVVLAVPGPAGSESVAGCHALIRDGAALCETVEDVVAETASCAWREPEAIAARSLTVAGGVPGRVVATLRSGPRSVDDLAEELSLPASDLAAALTVLEMEGIVVRGDAGTWWAAPSDVSARVDDRAR